MGAMLLSRSAESLYWLSRYVERADSTARLIEMGLRMTMLPGSFSRLEWRSVAGAAGCLDAFPDPDNITEADIVETLLLDPENPSSIRACLERARANARAVRTAISREMWEALNDGWRKLELMDPVEAKRDLPSILDWVKARAAMIRGTSMSTMLRNDGYSFLGLGVYVERADMTLRLLSVKANVLLPETDVIGGERDHHQWTSVLHATSAMRAYHHVENGDYSPVRIAEFLILNAALPRSVAFSYDKILRCLERLAADYGTSGASHSVASKMVERLNAMKPGQIFEYGLSDFLSDNVSRTNLLNTEIYRDYHF